MAIKIKHNGNWITIPTGENVIKVTYAELKALVDAGELKQAVEYEITDFVSTCIDATDSRFISAAIPYHVVVYAQTTKKLGMYAKAIPASEDASYAFKNCALDKWILKYDINADGYDWVSGGSTIKIGDVAYTQDTVKTLTSWLDGKNWYYYSDGTNFVASEKAPADFTETADAFSSPALSVSTEQGDITSATEMIISTAAAAMCTRNSSKDTKYYDGTGAEITLYGWDGDDGETYYTLVTTGNSVPVWKKGVVTLTGTAATLTKVASAPTGFTGTIYYMKDEFGNEAPYDFKNIKFKYTDNTYTGAITGIMFYDPTRDVTYTSGGTEVTLTAVSGTLLPDTAKMGFFDVTNKKIKTATFTFTNEWQITEVASDYSYIKANNKKWERVAAKDMDFSAYSGGNTYCAWVDDDANYAYTTTGAPTTDLKAYNTIGSCVLADGEEVTQTATSATATYTMIDNDNPTKDLSITGNAKNVVIKGNSDKSFPFIAFIANTCKNVFFAKDSNNVVFACSNISRVKFKGNQYLYVCNFASTSTDVLENYTFVNEFGGDSTETKIFIPTLNLATENLVGSADNGNTITKNPLKALQSFYQRNEPLNANEGDIWFSVED